jgi:hypothetical protein
MKMKLIITRIAPAVLITGLLLVSCQKNLDTKSKPVSTNLQHATNIAGLQSLLTVDDVQQLILTAYPNSGEAARILAGSCPPVVTYDPAPNVYPRIVTIDWGTGCTNVNGTTRSGKIIREYTDTLANLGARVISTYDNYFIDGVHIEGKATITHNQSTVGGDSVFNLSEFDRRVTQPNGDFINYNGSRRVIKYVPDDIHFPGDSTGWYRVTGTQSGDELKGTDSYQWIATIDDANPEVYKFCQFVNNGTLHVQFTNQSDWSVDFGKVGVCDDLAALTQDGVTTIVTLPLAY